MFDLIGILSTDAPHLMGLVISALCAIIVLHRWSLDAADRHNQHTIAMLRLGEFQKNFELLSLSAHTPPEVRDAVECLADAIEDEALGELFFKLTQDRAVDNPSSRTLEIQARLTEELVALEASHPDLHLAFVRAMMNGFACLCYRSPRRSQLVVDYMCRNAYSGEIANDVAVRSLVGDVGRKSVAHC